MGTFRIEVAVESLVPPQNRRLFQSVLVDTGAEYSVFPAAALDDIGITRRKEVRFRQADGTTFTRWTGAALIHTAGTDTTDDVVFGEPGDITLLGARTMEGLNVRVDPMSKQLIDAGPVDAGAFA